MLPMIIIVIKSVQMLGPGSYDAGFFYGSTEENLNMSFLK